MKRRKPVALILVLAGVLAIVGSVWSLIIGGPMLNWILPLGIGVLLLVLGLVLLIAELMEAWLSRGQRALVDGLQAG